MGLENGSEIVSCEAAKFNARYENQLCTLNIREPLNLKFRRKFKIYSAQNSPLWDF